ncbi:MAG: DUF479 domain-containing protein, partial [Saprospiraceae bacterium]|nr:DUF479 domain-containing protein [Saprospiraceae bacterium]
LDIYVDEFYNALERNYKILPSRIQHLLPYMIGDNWLLSYATVDGIQKVLEGMNRRTKNRSKMNLAVAELNEFYDEFESEFTIFFDELIDFTNEKLKVLSSQI